MTSKANRLQAKRVVASLVSAGLLMQSFLPVYAAPLQVPGIYLAPPDPNVMFTLDDSGSMQSDSIPDILSDRAGLPTNANSNALDQTNATYPGMWKANSDYLTTQYYRSDIAAARYLRSAAGNPLYYNPQVTYTPWPTPGNETTPYPNADPARVNIHISNPFNTGRRVDLTQRVNESGGAGASDDETRNFWPATYYVYTGTEVMPPARPNNTFNVRTSFTKYEIKSATATPSFPRSDTRVDCAGSVGPTGCSYQEELQNFANWLQYYRSRILMAKGGVAAAFSQQGSRLRVGFTTINTGATVRRGVSQFTGTNRQAFFNDLYGRGPGGSTPLRLAMDQVGRYFQGSNGTDPWAEDTNGTARPQADSCRKSFHILSTDGFWNGSAANDPASRNNDNFPTTDRTPATPTVNGVPGVSYPYTDAGAPGTLAARFTINPYRDNVGNTLADVAAYYWKTDLSPLENRVSPSTRDPAYWQHLTTFTVGLGISGSGGVRPIDGSLSTTNSSGQQVVASNLPADSPFRPYIGRPWLSDPTLRDVLVSQRTPMQWTTPTGDQPTTGDDLIHAAMNSRGRYFSATNPTELASGLASALAEATNQNSSFASVGVANSSSTSDSNRLYQAVYNPYGWTGRVYAFNMAGGTFNTNPANAAWEVSRAMPEPPDRNIFTWNPEAAIPRGSSFTWAGLTPTQRAALGPTAGVGSSVTERMNVLNYLRGDISHEVQRAGALRDRVRGDLAIPGTTGGVLGDVVGGSPLKGPDFGGGYQNMRTSDPGRLSYQTFRTSDLAASTISNMRESIYFGANDGMLHVAATSNGAERFAFVPSSVFEVPRTSYRGSVQPSVRKLYEYTRPDYVHLFTVDGPPQIGDAFIGAGVPEWKSILVGTTGAGSRSVFAMDVTNPQVGSGARDFNASKILWEFSDAQHADMGHIPSYAHIAKMRDGTWVAMFGNGYDSSSGRAKLFLLDLQTGAVVWEQAVGPTGGNGLSQPNFMLNEFREVVSIFAGDLRGNMWKFEVDSPNRADWRVAFNDNPLFSTAADQPITVMPELARFPNSNQAMVLFGTGKFFDEADISADSTVNPNLRSRQAIYSIWDNEATRVTNRSELVEQTIVSGSTGGYQRTSENTIDWATQRGWYLQLEDGTGERVNVNPTVPTEGISIPVFFTANTPSSVPCSSGGTARVFALDPITGQNPRVNVFPSASARRSNVLTVASGVLSSPSFVLSYANATSGVTTQKAGTRGQTGARAGGVTKTPPNATGCASGSSGRVIAGVSDTSTINETVRLTECRGRVSWRQIQ